MKHHLCGCRSIFNGYVQPLEREELYPDSLKLPLIHRHIVDVSELVMRTASGVERPHKTDGDFAYKLW